MKPDHSSAIGPRRHFLKSAALAIGTAVTLDRLPSAKRSRRVKGKNANFLHRWVNLTGEKGPPALTGRRGCGGPS